MLIRLLLGAKQARATILSWWKVGSKEFHKTLWHFVVSLPTFHRTKMLATRVMIRVIYYVP
jgi:hypothetical protein